MFEWAPFENLTLGEIYQFVRKLKTFNILDVPDNVLSKVASTVVATEKMGTRVRWGGSIRSSERPVLRETILLCFKKLDY